jgi:hypothetical protein
MRKTLGTMTIAAVLTAGGLATTEASVADSGCAPNGREVPRGAARAGAGDVDGDGLNDEVWVSNTHKGISTARGAVYAQKIANAGGPEVGVQVLDLNQDVVALIEQGRITYVSALADCSLEETYDADGKQLQFARGFADPYRDLGCIGDDDYSELNSLTLGYNSKYGEPWSVRQTVLNVSADGTGVSEGESSTQRYLSESAARAALDDLAGANTCTTEVA